MKIEMKWGEEEVVSSNQKVMRINEIVEEASFLIGEDPVAFANMAPAGKGRKALEWATLSVLTFEELRDAVEVIMRYSKNPDDVTALILCMKAEFARKGGQGFVKRLEKRIRQGIREKA